MAFLLTIRHNLEAAKDHFARDVVTSFDAPLVRVGGDPDCEQRVPDEAFPPVAFAIAATGTKLAFQAAGAGTILLNGKPAENGQELLSGDELRLEHWTFRVHKDYGEAGNPRRRTGLATLARLLVVLVLLAELSIVVWLPRQVQSAALRGLSLTRLRASALLDSLRNRVATVEGQEANTEADQIRLAALRAVNEDLQRRAHYFRRHGNRLSAVQCRSMYSELESLADLLDHLETGDLFQPIPPVNIDAAVRAALRNAPLQTGAP